MPDLTRFPLSWPAGWKRTPAADRRRARFLTIKSEWRTPLGGQSVRVPRRSPLSVADAIARLAGELHRLGAGEDVLVSTNVRTRLDGLPYSNVATPTDPGVAVYFRLNRKDRCLACDAWDRVADNVAAIAAHVNAIRAIDRYGVGTLDQAFAGYTALPAHAETDWWIVLGVTREASIDDVERAFRAKAYAYHPDRGGQHDEMVRLTAAYAAAKDARQVTA